jgi:type VI protein secretion system component VasA
MSSMHQGPVQQRQGQDVEEMARMAGAGTFCRRLPSTLYVQPNGFRTIGVTLLSGIVIHLEPVGP